MADDGRVGVRAMRIVASQQSLEYSQIIFVGHWSIPMVEGDGRRDSNSNSVSKNALGW